MSVLSRIQDIYRQNGLIGVTNGMFRFARWRLHNFVDYAYYKVMSGYYRNFHGGMCDISSEKWDNLIILDACRFDLFERVGNYNPNELDYRISKGPSTPEFLQANFLDRDLRDTVYVTANPQYINVGLENNFHDVIPVWDTGWDEQKRTVPPKNVHEAVKTAHDTYPNKRLLIHFMQPHYPFIGESAEQVGNHAGFELSRREALGTNAKRDSETVWDKLEKGHVDVDTVWEAYKENLELVLPFAKKTVEYCDGKSVITSDHGNLLGEFSFRHLSRKYGHPNNVYSIDLLKVPWLEFEYSERRKITQGNSRAERDEPESGVVEERLRHLGYTE